jgi:hypothetical protein
LDAGGSFISAIDVEAAPADSTGSGVEDDLLGPPSGRAPWLKPVRENMQSRVYRLRFSPLIHQTKRS